MRKLCEMLQWILTKLGRTRVIVDHLDPTKPYLIRSYILGGRNHSWFVLCLHQILLSDGDLLHSHPASYAALVLTGGYHERTLTGEYWRGPWSFRLRCADSFHRIQINHRKPVFTLFAMFRRSQDWYFLKGEAVAVPHAVHLGNESP